MRDETDFLDNAIAVDPPTCGCTDCIVGNSVNLDEDGMRELAVQALLGRRVINRTGRPLILLAAEGELRPLPEDAPHKWRFSKSGVTVLASRRELMEPMPEDVL